MVIEMLAFECLSMNLAVGMWALQLISFDLFRDIQIQSIVLAKIKIRKAG